MEKIKADLYSSDNFLNRKDETQEVKTMVEDFLLGRDRPRAIVFRGARGGGKSWLSLHLVRTVLPEMSNVYPFLISLMPVRDGGEMQENEWWPQQHPLGDAEQEQADAIEQILSRLADALELPKREQAGLEERSRTLAREVRELPRDQTLALVIDSAFESPAEPFRLLQTYVITPLLNSGRTVAVVTGRGRQTPSWQSDYLRDAKNLELSELDAEDVLELYQRHGGRFLDQFDQVLEYTGGFPLTVRLLAQSQKDQLIDALSEVIDLLIGDDIGDIERSWLRENLEPLAALERSFREDDGAELLETDEGRPLDRFREVRDRLLKLHLMVWDTRRGGFVLNQSLLLPLRGYLRQAKPEKWNEYRQKAVKRFESLAKKYEDLDETRQFYEELLDEYNKESETQSEGETK